MASFATQVQIRRGTDAENDAFTGAEGEVTMDLTNKQLRVHDGQTVGGMKIPNIETVFGTNQIANNAVTEEKIADNAVTESKLSADLQTKINEKTSGAGRNIGDIFWTARTDSALNGAVEANGAQYNFADVNGGDNNVQALLESGALPSVSIAKFDEMVAEQGGCDSFGWNGSQNVLYAWVGETGNVYYTNSATPSVGNDVFDLDGTQWGRVEVYNVSGLPNSIQIATPDGAGLDTATRSAQQDTNKVFKVPKKTPRILVRCQKPTADNNYTWYNVYADGWVEQGGRGAAINNRAVTITLPVKMADTNYFPMMSNIVPASAVAGNYNGNGIVIVSTSQVKFATTATIPGFIWRVSGYADPTEYTKDKWDYQNVQVERPMVQLFNGATDEAVAKCTEVLSDVADLKQTTDGMIDYVVESQEPTSENGYTWYRLYKSGWVEQGGIIANLTDVARVVLPIIMADENYTILAEQYVDNPKSHYWYVRRDIGVNGFSIKASAETITAAYWQVSGMAA